MYLFIIIIFKNGVDVLLKNSLWTGLFFLLVLMWKGIQAECSALNTVIRVFMESLFDAVMSPVW